MMQQLRDRMKYILGVTAVAFIATIIFSWGMGGFKDKGPKPGIVGEINGRQIQYQQFLNAVNQQLSMMREQSGGREITEYQQRSIRERVWQNTVREILFAQEIEKRGITASAQEVVFELRNNPPQFLRTNEQFLTDGEFDMAKYQEAITNPQNRQAWIPVENMLQSEIPFRKLQQHVLSSVIVSDGEVKEDFRKDNERVAVEYLFFDPNQVSLENIDITDKMMADYYNKHKDDFREPEKRKLQYIMLEGKPSQEDTLQTRYDIEDILEQIQNGDDFAELAKDYSEDEGSAPKGGDLGFFPHSMMETPFADAAFAAKVGDVVGPVETRHGLHLIKVLAKKREDGEQKVHARHILLKYKTSAETWESLRTSADYVYDESMKSKGRNFLSIVKEEGMEIKETPLFQEGGFIPGIGLASRIGHFAFNSKVGTVSEPIYVNDNIIIAQLAEIQKDRVKPLEDVKSSIERTLERQERLAKAGELCQAAWQKIENGAAFEEVAAADSMEIKKSGLITIRDNVPGVGRLPEFSGAAFRLPVGQVSKPIATDRGHYLLKVNSHTPMNEDAFNTEKDARAKALLQQKRQKVFMAWYKELQEKADIKDYRDQYFN